MPPSSAPVSSCRAAGVGGVGSLRLLALLCVLLPVLVYAIVSVVRYQQILRETEVRLDRSLRIAREHALKVFETNETVLDRLVSASESTPVGVVGVREAWLHDVMKGIARDRPQIQSIWVLGSDGAPVASSHSFPPPKISALDRDYFQWHRDRGSSATYLTGPLIGRTTGKPFFDMSRGRYTAEGRFDGVVSISLTPAYFEKFHDELAADEPGMAVTMFREDGTILSRWPQLADAPGKLGAQSPVMARIGAGQSSGSANGKSSVDGRERLLRYAKVGPFPVYLGTGMDVQQIRNRWIDEMAGLVLLGLPALLGVFIAMVVALRRTRELLDAAHQLTEETQARRRVEEALLQAQKLEALGRLTGGVAHDFNNALMVISSNLFLIRRRHPDVAERQTESIGRAVEAATRLTRQLLAFSRRQALLPKLTRLQELLPGLQDLLAPVLGSRITLAIEVHPDTAPIVVDAAELELALINLAINARDAMRDGGRFTLEVRNARPEDVPPTMAGTPAVLLAARDNGTGIPPALIARVFEPFFTTKPVGEGTGLGLSQVYGLCVRAGGLATIRNLADAGSEPGTHGTEVQLFFPAAADEAPADVPTPTRVRRLGLRLLVVEDNDDVAEALTPLLEDLGATVERVAGAAAALQRLNEGAVPQLLLSDVVMPGEMDGLQLAQEVRERHPALPIVLMTGYASQIDAIVAAGFEVIPKPYSADVLLDAIERARAMTTARPVGTPDGPPRGQRAG